MAAARKSNEKEPKSAQSQQKQPSQEQEHQPGRQAEMGLQPAEVAPSDVFLASEDSSYMSGQILHPNGGEVVNG